MKGTAVMRGRNDSISYHMGDWLLRHDCKMQLRVRPMRIFARDLQEKLAVSRYGLCLEPGLSLVVMLS